MHPRFRRFPPVFPEKRLDLKSLKGRTKAEEEGTQGPVLQIKVSNFGKPDMLGVKYIELNLVRLVMIRRPLLLLKISRRCIVLNS